MHHLAVAFICVSFESRISLERCQQVSSKHGNSSGGIELPNSKGELPAQHQQELPNSPSISDPQRAMGNGESKPAQHVFNAYDICYEDLASSRKD